MSHKRVVILGGGFGGIAAALSLQRQNVGAEITVIDQKPYQLIHGNLYEVATAPEELTDLVSLKRSVAIPLTEVFEPRGIVFKQGYVTHVDVKSQRVELNHGHQDYDYLVLALGSIPNFYGIPGAEQYSIPLKSIRDVLRIRDRVEFVLEERRLSASTAPVRVVVAGGGIAGIELAAELQGMFDFVAWKNNFARSRINTLVVEGMSRILPGFHTRVVDIAEQRLHNLGVSIQANSMIANVSDQFVEFKNGERLQYDMLIWTAGVQAASVPISDDVPLERGGRMRTDMCFRLEHYQNMFILGDQCCYFDTAGIPLPGTASQAMDQGVFVGQAIAASIRNQKPPTYSCRQMPFLIPLGGKWAIFKTKHFVVPGYLGYLVREFAWLKYFISIIGFTKAIRLLWFEEQLFKKND